MRKAEIQSWEELMAAEIADWDRADTTEEQFMDEILATGESFEELHCGEREHDLHRWELDPASAEDYTERNRGVRRGLSQRWRHFGH